MSMIIIYQDMNRNFYRPIPPSNLSEEEAKGWFPFLSRMDSRSNQALILYRSPRVSARETPTRQNESQSKIPLAPSKNDRQAFDLSHPPGFDPKVIPQPIQDAEDSMKQGSSLEMDTKEIPHLHTSQISHPQLPIQERDNQKLLINGQGKFHHDQVRPVVEGSSNHQPSPHNGGVTLSVSISNSTPNMHYTH